MATLERVKNMLVVLILLDCRCVGLKELIFGGGGGVHMEAI